MTNLKVVVPLLNKRTAPVENTADKTNIVGQVKEGYQFESTDEETNSLGTWYKDRDNSFYWGGGVMNILMNSQWTFNSAKMSWAFDPPSGLDILSLWNLGLTGQKIRVAVLDSGLDISILDIVNSVKDLNNDLKSFVLNEDIKDIYGHGTMCASVLASTGINLYGSAPDCELIIGKIYSKNIAIDYDVLLQALKWACEERNADIVSLSFNSSYQCEQPNFTNKWKQISDYINTSFLQKNKLFVAAIGDVGELAKDLCVFPANIENAISVGAFDLNRIVWNGSSWNKKLSMISPGVGLYGYDLSKLKVTLEPATSFACPFIAGVLANFISYYRLNGKSFNASDFVNRLNFDIPYNNESLQYGKGILNTLQTLKNIKDE
jgi:subtilisin family serine protease